MFSPVLGALGPDVAGPALLSPADAQRASHQVALGVSVPLVGGELVQPGCYSVSCWDWAIHAVPRCQFCASARGWTARGHRRDPGREAVGATRRPADRVPSCRLSRPCSCHRCNLRQGYEQRQERQRHAGGWHHRGRPRPPRQCHPTRACTKHILLLMSTPCPVSSLLLLLSKY